MKIGPNFMLIARAVTHKAWSGQTSQHTHTIASSTNRYAIEKKAICYPKATSRVKKRRSVQKIRFAYWFRSRKSFEQNKFVRFRAEWHNSKRNIGQTWWEKMMQLIISIIGLHTHTSHQKWDQNQEKSEQSRMPSVYLSGQKWKTDKKTAFIQKRWTSDAEKRRQFCLNNDDELFFSFELTTKWE